MTNVRPPSVGRTWYVEIREGTIGSQVFLGTRHVATGDQLWTRLDWGTTMAALTEREILDELYAATLQLMEAHSHLS